MSWLIEDRSGRGSLYRGDEFLEEVDSELSVYEELSDGSSKDRPGTKSIYGSISLVSKNRTPIPDEYVLQLEDKKKLKIIIINLEGSFRGSGPFFRQS